MRLDARKGECGWFIWHCEQVKALHKVLWVDDSTQEYSTYTGTYTDETVHRARKIQIISSSKTILINPIEDTDAWQHEEVKMQKPKDSMMRISKESSHI